MKIIVKDGFLNLDSENKIDFQELKEDFLKFQDVSPSSLETYNIALRQFCSYLQENRISRPERKDIIRWREELKEDLKPTTINGYLIAVRNFFKYLNYMGIYKNITENVKGIKIENIHLKRGLTEEEIRCVLSVCENEREKLITLLTFSCALRSNEVVNIRLRDFYNDNGVIMLKVLGKGRDGYKQDSVKIDDRLFELIKEYIQNNHTEDYLFVSNSNRSKGQKLNTKTIRQEFKKLFEKAGIKDLDKVSFHSLRHSSVTISLEKGMSIQEVSESARHKNIATTMIYKNELDKRNSLFANTLCDIVFE